MSSFFSNCCPSLIILSLASLTYSAAASVPTAATKDSSFSIMFFGFICNSEFNNNLFL